MPRSSLRQFMRLSSYNETDGRHLCILRIEHGAEEAEMTSQSPVPVKCSCRILTLNTVARRFFHVRFFQNIDSSNEILSPDAFFLTKPPILPIFQSSNLWFPRASNFPLISYSIPPTPV